MTEAGAPWQQYDLSDSDADDAEARLSDRGQPVLSFAEGLLHAS